MIDYSYFLVVVVVVVNVYFIPVQTVDVPSMLKVLRDQRMNMVQTVSQYSFVYQLLVLYLQSSRLI